MRDALGIQAAGLPALSAKLEGLRREHAQIRANCARQSEAAIEMRTAAADMRRRGPTASEWCRVDAGAADPPRLAGLLLRTEALVCCQCEASDGTIHIARAGTSAPRPGVRRTMEGGPR